MKKIMAVICMLILGVSACSFAEDEPFEGRNAMQFAASYPGHFNKLLESQDLEELFQDTFDTFRQLIIDSRFENDGCYGCNIPNGYARISQETGNIMYIYSYLITYKNGESTTSETNLSKVIATIASLEYEYRYAERNALGAILGDGKVDNVYNASANIISEILTEENAKKLNKSKGKDEAYICSHNYDYYLVYIENEFNGDMNESILLEIKHPEYNFSPLTDN